MSGNQNPRLRVGVCGVGSLGQWHARIYSEMPEAELVGVYDADPARAREIAARYSTRAYDSLETLAADCEALNIVVPTDRHLEAAAIAIGKGCHVLVEKPLAATLSEAEEIVRRARSAGICLQVGHVERFNPVLAAIPAEWNLRYLEAQRLAPYPPPRSGLPPRGTEVSVVLDLMIHDLDVILQRVSSPVVEIRALGAAVLSPGEDIANARLQFANGCVAQLTASRLSPERLRKLRIFAPEGYLGLDYQTQTAHLRRPQNGSIVQTEVPIARGEPLALELRAFVESVQRGVAPPVTGEQAVEALRVALEIIQSIRQGAPG